MPTIGPRRRTPPDPMSRRPGGRGRERLLDAVERLVALHGVEGTTTAMLLAESGHRNRAAVQYHFGSLEALVHEARARRIRVGLEVMRAGLDAAHRDGTTQDTATLMRLYVASIAAAERDRTPAYFVRFGMRWQPPQDRAFEESVAEHVDDYGIAEHTAAFGELLGLVRARIDGGRDPVASERLMLIARFVGTAFATWEEEVESGARDAATLDDFSDHLARLCTVMVDAPA